MPLHIPAHDLWWLAAGGASYGARYVKSLLRSTRHSKVLAGDDLTTILLELQAAYGYNAHSLVSIAPGAQMWSLPGMTGAVVYGEFGRVWLAAGDPLGPPEATGEIARRFAAAAKRKKRIAAFVPATAHLARQCVPLGLSALKVGAAPYFDLKTWAPRGDRAKKMRAGVNQARRAGLNVTLVEALDERLREETARLCLDWLKTRRAATSFSWLLALDPFLHAEHKKFFTARDRAGRLVGFLAASPMPARDCWYLEDVLREPDAPQGTADLLVVEALQGLAEAGASLATLGTSPLASEGPLDVPTGDHPVIERTLHMAGRRLGSFYNFEGLRRFKAKFAPSWWESEYALAPRGVMVPTHVTQAILRAIVPGGLPQLLTRKLARKLKSKQRRAREQC